MVAVMTVMHHNHVVVVAVMTVMHGGGGWGDGGAKASHSEQDAEVVFHVFRKTLGSYVHGLKRCNGEKLLNEKKSTTPKFL